MMVRSMENNKSLLNSKVIPITPKMSIRIPSVGEILDNEQSYYNITTSLTGTPFQYMVQLDDMGIDYTTISDYDLFLMLFPTFAKEDLSLVFGDLDTSDFAVSYNPENDTTIIYSRKNDIIIDEYVYSNLVDSIRKVNLTERVKTKPGNEEAKKYLLEKERKKQKRNANKKHDSYLEKLIIALVNRPEFKYNYEETMDLSIYKFNHSFKQIQSSIAFDNTMIGVYSGTVDTSKLKDKSCLSWIPSIK